MAAPGGVNPGGRCPKHRSYFQTSSEIYRSVSDLQPLMATIVIIAADTSSCRLQSCVHIAPSPRAASPARSCGHESNPNRSVLEEASQPYPTWAARQENRTEGRRGGSRSLETCDGPAVGRMPAGGEATLGRRDTEASSALAMADAGAHATLLLAQFASPFARFLNTHSLSPRAGRPDSGRVHRERL
jgi:hypothetical protein